MLESARKISLTLAEATDSWRVFPRMMIAAYGYLVLNLYQWFISIPTHIQYKCDPALLQILLDKGISLIQAKETACTIINTVGGPTLAQSAFVTTIIGLSTAVFGLYTTTGRRWENWSYNPFQQNYDETNPPPSTDSARNPTQSPKK